MDPAKIHPGDRVAVVSDWDYGIVLKPFTLTEDMRNAAKAFGYPPDGANWWEVLVDEGGVTAAWAGDMEPVVDQVTYQPVHVGLPRYTFGQPVQDKTMSMYRGPVEAIRYNKKLGWVYRIRYARGASTDHVLLPEWALEAQQLLLEGGADGVR